MKKKIIITVIVLLVAAGAISGGIYAYTSYQDSKLIADVTSVSGLNWGYNGSDMESYGMITNDMSQDIYLNENQTVSEVLVEEGQTVAMGIRYLLMILHHWNYRLK